MNTIAFREGLAHARSYFQDITGKSHTITYPEILANIENQASQRQGDFALGMNKFVTEARNVLSGANAVETSAPLR